MSQRLDSFLAGNPELRQLSRKAGELMALQRHYQQLAPSSLIRYSHVLLLEQKILTLAADNGAVAAKLRQLAPELVRLLQNKGCEVTGIRVRVQVSMPDVGLSASHATISPAAQQRLTELAVGLPDSPLKNALQRLAKKAGQRAKN